jgi:hypothetical protein
MSLHPVKTAIDMTPSGCPGQHPKQPLHQHPECVNPTTPTRLAPVPPHAAACRGAAHLQDVFEIGRRYKIMNPEKMRSEFGKLMYMLMDSADTHVQVRPGRMRSNETLGCSCGGKEVGVCGLVLLVRACHKIWVSFGCCQQPCRWMRI